MKTSRERPLQIYTDGSCVNYKSPKQRAKHGCGGWAFIVRLPERNHYGHGFSAPPQTNQTMELQAVLEAMKWAIENGYTDEFVTIRSDSLYVINGMVSHWRHEAAETDFENVPNAELWRQLHHAGEKMRRLRFVHVKGHAGNKYNEMCDRIASRARRSGMFIQQPIRKKR